MMRRIRGNKELEEDWPMRRIPVGTNRHNLSPTTMPLTHSTKRDLWLGGDGVDNDDDGVHRWLYNDAHRVHHYHTFITIALMHWATLDDSGCLISQLWLRLYSVSEIFIGQYNTFFYIIQFWLKYYIFCLLFIILIIFIFFLILIIITRGAY